MSTEPRIMTLHPQGKAGVNILLRRYEQVKTVLLEIVSETNPIPFDSLTDKAEERLKTEKFDGKPLWYIVSVKLDLEARGILKRVPKTSPHQLRLTQVED